MLKFLQVLITSAINDNDNDNHYDNPIYASYSSELMKHSTYVFAQKKFSKDNILNIQEFVNRFNQLVIGPCVIQFKE